jgi:ABC-type sugar transport system ATPase subunit
MQVYARPANTFVARFIGAPPMNLIPATVAGIDAPAGAIAGIRPHDVLIGAAGSLRGTVDLVEPRGHDHLIHLRLTASDSAPLLAIVDSNVPSAGAEVAIQLRPGRLHLFDGRTNTRLPDST